MKNSGNISKTLYLSYDGMTDPLGQSQVIPYLKGLSEKGFEVHLVSFEKEEANSRKAFIQTLLIGASIQWHPLKYNKRPPVLSTLWDIYQLRKTATKLYKRHHFSVVHCRSYIAALVGLFLKGKYGIRLVFDMRGFWADERIDGGIWNLKNPLFKTIYNFFKKKEQEFLKEADAIISLTENGKQEMLSWPVAKERELPITVIPCCVDLDHFNPEKIKPEQQAEWRNKLGVGEGDFVLSYLGSVGTWYMLHEMLDFFKQLHSQNPKARFLFISGESPDFILSEAKQKGIAADQIIIQKGAREEVPTLISLSDLSIFFIKPVFSKKASSPTKQGELMAMGVPVICNSGVGDTDYVVEKYGAGTLVKTFSSEAYQQAIDQIPVLLQTDPEKLRKGADEYFSLEGGVEKYYQVYQEILSE